MTKITLNQIKCWDTLLAFGPESMANFCYCQGNDIFLSKNYGDLLNETDFLKYKKTINRIVKQKKPDIILADLHPLYRSSVLAQELSKQHGIKLIKVQHHYAHLYGAIGDYLIQNPDAKLNHFTGIVCDGTGYGQDKTIWGGEVLEVKNKKINRIGALEEQILLGGDLATLRPSRMLASILLKTVKDSNEVYTYIKKYYSKNEFNLLVKQFQQKFNCTPTTSTGRILDAVSLLLGFSGDEPGAALELEKYSSKPYNLSPKPFYNKSKKLYQLPISPLFNYLIKNINKDRQRLAATALIYLAEGFYQIAKKPKSNAPIFFTGGVAYNKVMADYLKNKDVILNIKIPQGDASLSFGQIIYYLFAEVK